MSNENNQLQVLPKQQMNIQEMQSMAKLFAESGMFTSVNSMAKAFVKIQAGIELGIAPFAAMSGIHIIKEKATVGAGLMAGKIKASGKYDYEVAKLTNEVCEIHFFENGKKKGTETFTIADAKKAGTQNLDKFPKNMLFARAISNGMKFYCPDLYTMPVYTPDEMQVVNTTEDVQHEEVDPVKKLQSDINELKTCTTIDELKKVWGENTLLQQCHEYISAKDEAKARLTPWQLSEAQQEYAQSFINSSTLDKAAIKKAATAIATCKSQAQFAQIIAHLQTLQNEPTV